MIRLKTRGTDFPIGSTSRIPSIATGITRARVARMMLALDQNIALQIVTCFEQRRLRVSARVGFKKHTNVFNDELHNQWRVVRRRNLKVRRRVKYVRVHVATKEKRIATN